MTTRSLVPRATGEGSLGKATKVWGDLRTVNATITGTLTIPDKSIALSKTADISTGIILGRNTSGSGVTEQLTVETAKAMLGVDATASVNFFRSIAF